MFSGGLGICKVFEMVDWDRKMKTKSIVYRMNRFVILTTRDRKMVKAIRLKTLHYFEYKQYLVNLQRHHATHSAIYMWDLHFCGIPVSKHPWL